MPMTPRNIVRHELIGLKVKIQKSTDKSQNGASGKVVDETYNTIHAEIGGEEKAFVKKNCIFIFTLPDKTKVMVDGALLVSEDAK